MNLFIYANALPEDRIGGTEVQTLELAKQLSGKHKVIVFTRGYKGCMREEQLPGFLVLRSPANRVGIPLSLYTLSGLYALFKRRARIDVIICMSARNGFVGVLAKKLFKIPVVVSIRSEGEYKEKSFLFGLISKYVIQNADSIWVQSNVIKNEFLRAFPNDKAHVIGNGLQIDGRVSGGDMIIYVGRIEKNDENDKGVEYLIEAMTRLQQHKLLIVGDGPERRRLEEMARGLPVEFAGNVPHAQVTELLLSSGVFAFPAVYGEGLPNAVLEALSVGLPVVATTSSKLEGIVRDGETGFLVEPKNPEQMAARLRQVLEDGELRMMMSENCLREAEKYSWDEVMPKITEMLEEVAG